MPLKLKTLLGAASALFLAAVLSTASARTSAAEDAKCTIFTEARCNLYVDRLSDSLNAVEMKYLLLGCLYDHGCDPYDGKKLN